MRVGVDVEVVLLAQLDDPGLRAVLRSNVPTGPLTLSAPSATASTTSKTGTSWKCWWTMPMPASIACRGSVKVRGVPSIRISPESGL